jgi:hypothetical protein
MPQYFAAGQYYLEAMGCFWNAQMTVRHGGELRNQVVTTRSIRKIGAWIIRTFYGSASLAWLKVELGGLGPRSSLPPLRSCFNRAIAVVTASGSLQSAGCKYPALTILAISSFESAWKGDRTTLLTGLLVRPMEAMEGN